MQSYRTSSEFLLRMSSEQNLRLLLTLLLLGPLSLLVLLLGTLSLLVLLLGSFPKSLLVLLLEPLPKSLRSLSVLLWLCLLKQQTLKLRGR